MNGSDNARYPHLMALYEQIGTPEQCRHMRPLLGPQSASKRLLQWCHGPKEFITLVGSNGTGKTTAACRALLYARMPPSKSGLAPRTAKFISCSDLYYHYIEAMKAGSPRELLSLNISPGILCIDDVGIRPPTDGWREWLTDLLDKRRDANSKTIITTNLRGADVRAYYGDAIVSRLAGEVLHWDGEDQRWMTKKSSSRA